VGEKNKGKKQREKTGENDPRTGPFKLLLLEQRAGGPTKGGVLHSKKNRCLLEKRGETTKGGGAQKLYKTGGGNHTKKTGPKGFSQKKVSTLGYCVTQGREGGLRGEKKQSKLRKL